MIGSVARVQRSPNAGLLLSDKVFRLRGVAKKVVSEEYLVFALSSSSARSQILVSISGADGLANNLPASSLLEFWLAIPPAREQKEIVELLSNSLYSLDVTVQGGS